MKELNSEVIFEVDGLKISSKMKKSIEKLEKQYGKLNKRFFIERDERDMNREIAPLKQAEDAVFIDSSDMSIEQVAECIVEQIYKSQGENNGNH